MPVVEDLDDTTFLSYAKLGAATGDAQWWSKALEIPEHLTAQGRLAPSDAKLLEALRTKVAASSKDASFDRN